MLIISACLVGINCRYDGSHKKRPDIITCFKEKGLVPVCPEQLAGLCTPRPHSQIVRGTGFDVLDHAAKVIDSKGTDLTSKFLKGAEECLKIACLVKARMAILKERSPSCGVLFASSDFKKGPGVLTALLIREKITPIPDETL